MTEVANALSQRTATEATSKSDTMKLQPSHLCLTEASAERRHLLLAGAAMLAGRGGGTESSLSPELSLQVSFEGLQGMKFVRLRDSPAGKMA